MPYWFGEYFYKNDDSKFAECLADRIIDDGKNGNLFCYNDMKHCFHMFVTHLAFENFLGKAISHIFDDIKGYKESEQEFLYRELFYMINLFKLTNLRHKVYNYIIENYHKNAAFVDSSHLEKLKLAMLAFSTIQPTNEKYVQSFWLNMWGGDNKNLWPIAFVGLCKQDPETACLCIPKLMSRNKNFIDVIFNMWKITKTNIALQKFFTKEYDIRGELSKKEASDMSKAKHDLAYKITQEYDVPFIEAMNLIHGLSSKQYKKVKN